MYTFCIQASIQPHLIEVNRLASHHVLPVFSHLQEVLHSLTPTLSYRLRHWEISHTGVFCTFLQWQQALMLAVTCFSSEVNWRDTVCFNYSELASLSNGWLCVKHPSLKEDHIASLFPVKNCSKTGEPFKNQTKPVLNVAKEKKKKKNSPTAKSSCQNK